MLNNKTVKINKTFLKKSFTDYRSDSIIKINIEDAWRKIRKEKKYIPISESLFPFLKYSSL